MEQQVEQNDSLPRHQTDLMVGSILGSYRIVDKIAHGGMGVVYRGEHMQLGRKVAIKLLKPERVHSPEAVKRFLSEARAVNEIRHPNIVDIIDFVENYECDPPAVYTVMELLDGEDLADRLDDVKSLTIEETLKIAIQMADAFIATHRVQIIHRDLKPANIFLARTESGGECVKLLDFGVAKTFGDRQAVDITDPGTSVGTPRYMAPEQVLGKKLDGRTDIYAMGIVMYQMLSGVVPFDSDQYGEILVSQVKETPNPVTSVAPPGKPIPAVLERVVMRCLEKERARRFQSMTELRDALRQILDGTAPADAFTMDEVRVLSRVKESRAIRWGAGIAAAVLLVTVALLVWRPWKESDSAAATSTVPNPREASSPAATVAPNPPETTTTSTPRPAPTPASTPPAPVDEPKKAKRDLAADVGTVDRVQDQKTSNETNAASSGKLKQRRRKKRKTRTRATRKRSPAPRRDVGLEGTVDPFAQFGK